MRFFQKAASFKTSLNAIRTNKGGQRYALLLAGLAATSAIACGAEDPSAIDGDESEVGQIEEGITGGSLVTNNNAPWGSAVKIGGCSGLKVGARWYLTATHCGFATGQTQTITNSLNGLGGTSHTLSEVANHPSTFQLAVNNQWWDLTLIRVNSDNAIPIHTPTFSAQSVGDQGYFLGYGCDNANPGNANKKQFGFSTPTQVPPASPWPGLDPNTFYAASSPTVCPGDSGGPFFKVVGTQYHLAGMNRAVSGSGSYWNRIYGAADWINAVKGGLPGHNNFTGGNGGTFINMWSNICLDTQSGSQYKQQACRFLERPVQRAWVGIDGTKTRFGTNGVCLGPVNGSTASGAAIGNVTCGTTESNWTSQNPSGQFRQWKNEKSGLCMQSTSTAIGANIVQGTCTNTQDDYWVFSD
jgi:hypothetical protein